MAENAQNAEVSDEQAADALRSLLGAEQAESSSEPESITAVVPEKEDTPAANITMAEEETPETAQEQEQEPAQVDDIESLRASLDEKNTRIADLEKRNQSITESAKRSLQWAKDLALKKSTKADTYEKYLMDLSQRSGDVDQAEIQRVLQGQMVAQPQAMYQQPFQQPQIPQQVDDVAALDEQMFLLDNPMYGDQYDKFLKFVQTENVPGAFVPGNTYATLTRFKQAFDAVTTARSQEMSKAAKSIQRVQKQAQRAAGSISGRGSPSPQPEKKKDFMSMTTKEIEETPNLLSELFRRSIEE